MSRLDISPLPQDYGTPLFITLEQSHHLKPALILHPSVMSVLNTRDV